MKLLTRLLLLTGAATVVVALTAAAPVAAAATPNQVHTAASAATVVDEPWSSPAYPVSCEQTGPRVNCAPDPAKDAKAEQCFRDVKLDSNLVTVCTTYEGNVQAITDDGGQKMQLSFYCQFGDALCAAQETAARATASMITGGMVWVISNTSMNSNSDLWSTAIGEWAWWQGAVLLVILIAGIYAIAASLWSGDRGDFVGTLIRFALTFPLSAASVWLIGTLLNIVDGMIEPLIARGGGGEGLYKTIENMIYSDAVGNIFLANIVLLLLALGVGVLILVFSFRNIALAALIALGPVAWMLFPTSFGKDWVVKYWSAVLALLLTTPMTLGFLMLILRGIGGVDSMWSFQAFPLGIGLLMISFAPIATFALFSFAGSAAADGVGSRLGTSAGQTAKGGVRSMSTQLGSRSDAVRARASQVTAGRGGQQPPTPASTANPGGRRPAGRSPQPQQRQPAPQPSDRSSS